MFARRRDAGRATPHRRSRDRRDVLRRRRGRRGRRRQRVLLSDHGRRPMASPSVWRSRDLGDASEWTHVFTRAERTEICGAVEHAKALGRTRATLTLARLPAAGLGGAHRGLVTVAARRAAGSCSCAGFPSTSSTPTMSSSRTSGLGLQLGTPVSQDARGIAARSRPRPRAAAYRSRSAAVRDDATAGLPHRRRRHHRAALPAARAKRGGESRIVSAAAVYNEILARDPHLLDVLYEPMYWDRNGEQSPGEDPFFRLPVLHDVDGRPRFFYIGWYIRDAQRHPQVPRLTADQLAAMELIETIANDPAVPRRDGLPTRRRPTPQQRGDPARARGVRRLRGARAQAPPPAAVAECARLLERRETPCAAASRSARPDDRPGPGAPGAARKPSAPRCWSRSSSGRGSPRSGSRRATSACSCSRTRPRRARGWSR